MAEALAGVEIVNFHIPLVDEPRIELISDSHKCLDLSEELDVRVEKMTARNMKRSQQVKALKMLTNL